MSARKRSLTEIAATEYALHLLGLEWIGKAVGRWPSAVHHWKKAGIPAEFVISIERMTEGAGSKVPKEALRPDLYTTRDGIIRWQPPKKAIPKKSAVKKRKRAKRKAIAA